MNPHTRRRLRQQAEATRPPGERTGYIRELLAEQVRRLQAVSGSLCDLQNACVKAKEPDRFHLRMADYIQKLRNDVADMIRAAEAEHAAFPPAPATPEIPQEANDGQDADH